MGIPTRSGARWGQDLRELDPALDLIHERMMPTSYLEIGAREGDTLWYIAQRHPQLETLIAVEYPQGPWGRKNSQASLDFCIEMLQDEGRVAEVIYGNSQIPYTREFLTYKTGISKFDFILIDADHTLTGVSGDWYVWHSITKCVMFHDINGWGQTSRGHRVEVPEFWEQIKREHPDHHEFIAPGSRMGIGVVFI